MDSVSLDRRRVRVWAWLGIVVVVFVVLAVAQSVPGHRLLVVAGLAAEPSVTTELYFDPEIAVPPALEPGRTDQVAIAFFVGNVAPVDRDVPWEIAENSSGSLQVRSQGVANGLRPEDRRSESVSILLSCGAGPSFELVVRIPGEPIEIRKKIVCGGSGRGGGNAE